MKATYKNALREANERQYNIGICAKILNEQGDILLIKRSMSDTSTGIWEMPGGAVDGDETLEMALAREIQEETGLHLEKVLKYVGCFDFHNLETKKTKRKFCFVVNVSGTIQLSDDHEAFKWFEQSEINQLPVEGRDLSYQIWRDHYEMVMK